MENRERKSAWHGVRFDLTLALALTVGVFILYTQTLVPSVLDGDQGEYQLMLPALGIPHPTGFPLYVLLGHLWSYLPIGSLAYRANLFSAFWASLTVGAFFVLLRRMNLRLVAALGAALTLALIAQFWEYATVAAVYRLHTFIAVLFILCLNEWEMTRERRWLYLALLTAGIGLSNHLLIVFYGPAAILFAILVGGRLLLKQIRFYLWGSACLLVPQMLYAYVPLRGHQLLTAPEILEGVPKTVAQGVLSPFFHDGAAGVLAYLTGSTFISTALRYVSWSPGALFVDWIANITNAIGALLASVALVGLVWVFRHRPRLGVFLIVAYLTVQFLMLQYGFTDLAAIGQFSPYFREYFLSSFIALVVVVAWGLDGILRASELALARIGIQNGLFTTRIPSFLLLTLLLLPFSDFYTRRPLTFRKRSAEIEAKWQLVKRFAPEQDAALVGHWGDLTPFWYTQYADNWRRDLVALFPPQDEQINAWLASGRPLYLAGPLLDWAPQTAHKYSLTPWGPLVRVTNRPVQPVSPLSGKADWTFEDDHATLRVTGFDVSGQDVRIGEMLDVALYWDVSLDDVSIDDYILRVTLTAASTGGVTPPQLAPTNYPLFVSWMPTNKLYRGQRALGTYRYIVPWWVQPGAYRLEVEVYSIANAATVNRVQVAPIQIHAPLIYPDRIEVDHPAYEKFDAQFTFLGWEGDVKRLVTGDRALIFLFGKPEEVSPTVEASVSLQNAQTSRIVGTAAIVDNLPERGGEITRTAQRFSIPADLPEGDYDLLLRVRSTNGYLPVIKYFLPIGDSVRLARIKVVGRVHSYDVPPIQHSQSVSFDRKASLLGYALDANAYRAGDTVKLELFWQAQSLMNESYKVFAHVLDADGKVVAQQDSIPAQGATPTTSWLPREVIADAYSLTLPRDLAGGTYRIEIGFYNADDGGRLPVVGTNQDFVILEGVLRVGQ